MFHYYYYPKIERSLKIVEFGTPFAFTLLIVAYFFKIIQQSI
ncbi:hypothetical protein N403_08045 [Helicobacter pylori FD430]|nr:hypothetical protein N403_08045 [Helicobacter pylori FD430]EQL57001.1 hypothetical protein N411_06780 [Helicobacter pylori FD535]